MNFKNKTVRIVPSTKYKSSIYIRLSETIGHENKYGYTFDKMW